MSQSHKMPSQPTVVVIGAGIIGLTCALKLQDRLANEPSQHRPDVLLVARETPGSMTGAPPTYSVDYASMWAGAHVRPIPATSDQLRREAHWLKQSVAEFRRQVNDGAWQGVTSAPAIEFLEEPDLGYRSQSAASFEQDSGLSGYRQLEKSELPEEVKLGFEYQTFCINSPLYCQSLMRRFVSEGGRVLESSLNSEWEAYKLAEKVLFVVNASGIGFGDEKSFPTRGQTIVTNMYDAAKTVTRQLKDGSWSFIIPRFFNGGTIVGGTKEPRDWRDKPCAATRERLLSRGAELRTYAQDPRTQGPGSTTAGEEDEIQVLSDIVGRRPTREGGMRIEHVQGSVRDQASKEVLGSVIHAYGAGGRGYEISWGVASEVVEVARHMLPGGDDKTEL